MITVDTIRGAFVESWPRVVADLYQRLGAVNNVDKRKVRKLLQRLKKQGEVTLDYVLEESTDGQAAVIRKTRVWELTEKGLSKIRPVLATEKIEQLPAYTKVWRVVRGLGSHGKIFTISDVATIAEAPYLDAMAAIFALTYLGYVHPAEGGYRAAVCCQNQPEEPPLSHAFEALSMVNGIIADAAALFNRIARIKQ